MSATSDGPGAGPVEEPVEQTGRPPVPGRAPADDVSPAGEPDGTPAGGDRHHTERVPFPLPAPKQAPQTGRLQLGGYPPRVPGAGRRAEPAPADENAGGQAEDDGPRRPR
ncbi:MULTISPECIES: hypothetical protein [unclassified Modestobacter]